MSDVNIELVLETLKSLQGPLARVEEAQRDLKQELRGLREQMHADTAQLADIYRRLGRLEDRVERIERRLGFKDVTLS